MNTQTPELQTISNPQSVSSHSLISKQKVEIIPEGFMTFDEFATQLDKKLVEHYENLQNHHLAGCNKK